MNAINKFLILAPIATVALLAATVSTAEAAHNEFNPTTVKGVTYRIDDTRYNAPDCAETSSCYAVEFYFTTRTAPVKKSAKPIFRKYLVNCFDHTVAFGDPFTNPLRPNLPKFETLQLIPVGSMSDHIMYNYCVEGH